MNGTPNPAVIGKRRKVNTNCGKTPAPTIHVVKFYTAFEKVVIELQLLPVDYVRSPSLRDWVRRHKDSKFVPEYLLEAWGFRIELP